MRARHPCLTLAALLLAGAASLAEDLEVSAWKANVRDGPSQSATVLVTLDRGERLEAVGKTGRWYKVRVAASGLEGYVHSSMVRLTGATAAAPPALARGLLQVSSWRANVRSGAGQASPIVETLERGAPLDVLGATGRWYRVRTASGAEGFIHASMVQVSPGPPSAPAPPPPPPPAVAEGPLPEPEAPRPAQRAAEPPPPPPVPTAPLPAPRPPARVAPPQAEAEPSLGIRGFGQAGYGVFSAGDTFETVFGEATSSSWGFGAELRYRRFFLQVGVDRVKKIGERVFVFDGEVFPLGVENTVTLTPVSFIAGYRFLSLGRVTFLAGAGVGSYGFKEESAFASASEVVDERFTSYHLLAGAELAVKRWLAVRAEVQYTSVPDAIGVGGVSELFGETNLGGTGLRIKVLAGR